VDLRGAGDWGSQLGRRLVVELPPPRHRDAHRRAGGARSQGPGTLLGATPVLHSAIMPTQHRRHAITETPPVKAALDELREQLGDARIDFGELVTLGAHQKVAQLRATRDDTTARRRALAERLRRRDIPVDRAAADEVRRAGWARP
jgi:hypothetical protein